MNIEFEFNTEYLKECFKRRKKPEERKYPKKGWPVGYEPTKKEFEEWMEEGNGVPVSFHWEDIGGGRKRGVFTPTKKEKNMEILTDFEKTLGRGEPVNFQIKDPNGEIRKVSKEEFANWMIEDKEEKNVKVPPKEKIVYGASGDIDGTTVFTEKRGKDEIIRESYYQPRSEEEKNQIIERNKTRREKEAEEKQKSQTENSESKPTGTEKSTQPDKNQELVKDKNNNLSLSTKIIIGSGIVLVVGIISTLIIRNKRK